MFGIVRRHKPFVHAHWYVPLLKFRSDTVQFYESIEAELAEHQIPEITVERIDFKQAGFFSGKRTYLRLIRERVVLDICSAPFGKGWYFSLRAAELPRRLGLVELLVTLLGLLGFCALYWQLFGLNLGGVALGASFFFLFLLFIAGRVWGTLDECLIYLPVLGVFYENYFRPDTYQQQDHRLVYADMVTGIVRAKVEEFCVAGGAYESQLIKVTGPDQILTENELVKYGYKEGTKRIRN